MLLRGIERALLWIATGVTKWTGAIGAAYFDWLYFFLLRRPRLLRAITGAGRRWFPVLSMPGLKLLSRAADVHEVLERKDDFLLSPINERKLLSGDFIISLDPSGQYEQEKNLVRFAFDLPFNRRQRLYRIVTRAAERLLQNVPARGTIDIVPLVERVTVKVVKKFWGLNPDEARSEVVRVGFERPYAVGEETMRLWLRKLAAIIGSREPAPFGLKQVGDACAEEYVRFVAAECERRAAQPLPVRPPADVIGRIVWYAPRSEAAWRTAAGIVVTGSAVVSKAFTHAFEQLLGFPGPLAEAVRAARGNRHKPIERLMMEALRFNTVFPLLARYAPRATTIALGTERETDIPAGQVIAVAPTGAMFDPGVVDDPEVFSTRRGLNFNPDWVGGPGGGYAVGAGYAPAREQEYYQRNWSGIYMHFGGGAHWCPADEMALAEISALAGVVLRCLPNPAVDCWFPDWYRALRYDGPAVRSLNIRYG